ncbi:ankyrin repeat-containing domain protein [Suillus clintonianus]|uniref:ankyrin repeat-containing domain protein n=1 Tax=Suillus clintonianus TaxID=1904413 RepID=UPI001B85F6F6|nr:ankyrin repeat-containing domain protein [Suillus clintonianus]KAG2146832.1 ankyrin repeat-containing domain protein [Suillus clintonianus]
MATWNVVGEIANVGGVTSIVQLSLQVIFAVNSYASSVAGAEAARMSLRNELTSLNASLNHIFLLLRQSDAALSTRRNDLSPLDSALKECQKVLQDLCERIPENKRRSWLGSRLAWPFQQADIMKAVDKLERCKSALSLTISGGLLSHVAEITATAKEIKLDVKDEAQNIKQEISRRTSEVKQKIGDDALVVREEVTAAKLAITNRIDNSIAHITSTQEMITRRHEQEKLERVIRQAQDQERKDLLQWLGGFDCTVRHEEVSAQRQENTCTWVFEMKAFRQWKTPPTAQRGKFLWINGKPGAGKTVLVSAIINELVACGETPVYFYCDFRHERTTDGAIVLRSLLVQLLRQARVDWSSEFTDLFRRKSEGAEAPVDFVVLCDLVCRSLKFLIRPVAIIDALDECKRVGTFLTRLVSGVNEGDLRLLITSRTEQAISSALSGLPSLALSDYARLINNDMELHIDREIGARPRLASLAPDLKHEIRTSLLQQADGMFRWVDCQLDAISACRSVKGISDSLKSLPRGLYETYDRILQQIEEAGPDRRSIVERTLMWLVAALEPLNLSQLVEALSIEIGSTTLNQRLSVMSPTDLLEICSFLVSFDEKTHVVTLSHYSVREYLMAGENAQKYRHLLEDAHRHIVQYCAQYLISDDVLNSSSTRPMLRYALDIGLGAHMTSIIHEEDSVLSCLEDLPGQLCIRHPWNHQVARDNPWQIWLADPKSICGILVRFGPDWMIQRHLRERREHWNDVLQFAILEGRTQLANVVLGFGRDVNLPITIGSQTTSPVMFALQYSPQELVECFLRRGARLPVDAIHTTLEQREEVGSDILSLLIYHGANVRAIHAHFQDDPLHTLLRKDAQSQEVYLEASRVLVDAGCEYNALNREGWRPLDIAIMKSLDEVADFLLQKGATASDDAIRNHLENECLNVALISTLLRHGVGVNVQRNGASPLHILFGYEEWTDDWLEFAQALIEAGCPFDIEDDAGQTPLLLAIRYGSPDLLTYLISRGAHIPLDAIHDHLEDYWVDRSVIDTLIQHGADVNAVRNGANALHALLSHENWRDDWLRTAQLLIEAGCSIDVEDGEGYTPLRLAVRCGSLPLVKDLIGRGACIPAGAIHDYLGNDWIDHAIISALVQHGADVNAQCNERNPLHSLLHHRHWKEEWFKTARILVEAGSSLEAVDEAGQTPIYLAVIQGSVTLVKYLVGRGARVSADFVLDNLENGWIDTADPLDNNLEKDWIDSAMASVFVQRGVDVDHDGGNLLHALVGHTDTQRDNFKIAGVLIDAGCSLDATDRVGNTPLHLAIRQQPLPFIEYLIERGARVPVDAIHAALQSAQIDPDVVSVLVEHGADINAVHFGASPLHILLTHWNLGGDCLETVLFLLDAGCSLHAMDDKGNTPLHLAIRLHSLPLVEYLIQRGACIPADAIHDAVHPAYNSGVDLNPDIISALVVRGADVNVLRCGANPLHTLLRCTQSGDYLAITRILIDAGCQYDRRDSAGCTPLYLAIIHEIPSVMDYLLLKGASLHIDSIGIAIKDRDVGPDIIRNLLQHVADADVSSQMLTLLGHQSPSPLLHDSKCLEITKALVDAGCEQGVDLAGYSPLVDLAITQSLPRVTQYFLQVGSPIHINHPVHVTLNSDVPAPCTNFYGQEQWVDQLHTWQTDCRFQTMRALIEAGHDASSRDSAGQTPLSIAMQKRIPSAVNYLLGKLACGQLDFFCGYGLEEHNAEIITALLQSGAPLHALIRNVITGPVSIQDFRFSNNGMHGPFCERDCGEILLILIDEGFSVNAADSSGDTPLRIAIQRQLFLVVEYLLRRDPICDVGNIITAFGTQSHVWEHLLQKYVMNVDPLHTLISRMHSSRTGVDEDAYLAIMKSIVQAGCDVNTRDSSGITPLQHMCKLEVDQRYPLVREFLCEEGAV